jgi:hypothetical protein
MLARSRYLLAFFSPTFSVSIDQCSSDFETYSLALLGKTELENAIMPPTKKVMPVSRNEALEKYAGKKAALLSTKVSITNIKKLAAQMVMFRFIIHFKRE